MRLHEFCSLVCETGLEILAQDEIAQILFIHSQTSFKEYFFRKPSWNLTPPNRAEIRRVIGP